MTKINHALSIWKDGEIHSLSWFNKYLKMDKRSLHYHQKTGLLKALGAGVYARPNDSLNWEAAVSALQFEQIFPAHVSGQTALLLHGVKHHLPIGEWTVQLRSPTKRILPTWINKNDWSAKFSLKRSTLFKTEIGTDVFMEGKYPLKVSSRERAILELIEDFDLSSSFEEVTHYMESLRTLRSEMVQRLLEKCESIKVKRIFLYLSEKNHMEYFEKLNLKKIHLGKGKRSVVKHGKLDQKYGITIPKETQENPF